MCGIFGLISKKEKFDVNKVVNFFSKLKHRGEDKVFIIYKERLDDKESLIIDAKNFEELKNKSEGIKAKFLMGMNYFSIFGNPKIFENFVFNGEVFNIEEAKNMFNIKKIDNDGEILLKAIEEDKVDVLKAMYAFAYLKKSNLLLERDNIGVNPLFFRITDNLFIFGSENKVVNGLALNPRYRLIFNFKNWKIKLEKKRVKKFSKPKNLKELKKRIEELLIRSILEKSYKKTGILFSGGVDSTFIAKVLQDHEKKFVCLISGTEDSKDVNVAIKVAEEFGFNYKVNLFDKEKVREKLSSIIYYLETTDLMKVTVAIPLYFAGLLNDSRVLFSGIGSEELFGGYERHKNNPKKESTFGILTIWERDLYRDNVISFSTNNELRVPFLDEELVFLSSFIPDHWKIKKPSLSELRKIRHFDSDFNRLCKKYILRKIAEKYIGVYAWRPKKAAQYGSNSEKIIVKLAKEKNLYKKRFLNMFLPEYEKIENVIKIY